MEKVSLPIKTKIAAWWMIIIGGILIIFSLRTLDITYMLGGSFYHNVLLFALGALLLLFPTFLLFSRRKLAWYWAIITLSILSLFYIYNIFTVEPIDILIIFILAIPLILLLLDRKNFWKIAT